MPKQKLSAELQIGAGLSAGFSRVFDKIDKHLGKTLRGLKGFDEEIKGMPKGDKVTGSLGRGFDKLTRIFRNTNTEIGRTHDQIGALRKQGRIYEDLAEHAKKMGKAVQPWLDKVDRVNRELDRQERKLNQLRIARERLNKASRGFDAVRERVAPVARRLGYAGIGAAVGTGYALTRGAQDFSNFDKALRVLQAEGVDAQEIPLIREQIFKFAETTQFTDIEIAEVLVGMKKDGQAVTAELTGVADIMRLAVAESRSLPEAWDATRTLINTTKTDLAEALRLQEQMSNATSVSALNMEQLSYIAGQSLSAYRLVDRFQSEDFLAVAGSLGGILRPERIATGMRKLSTILSKAAAGGLEKNRQERFDLLGLNIADEEGRLLDFVSILKEFERGFEGIRFQDAEGNIIGNKVVTDLEKVFGEEALSVIANLVGQSDKIAANIEKINTPGTLERKAGVMEQSLDAASNRLKSAVSVATKRFFLAMEGDGDPFVRMLDTMSAGVQKFSEFITKHEKTIAAGTESFLTGLGQIAGKGIEIGQKLFNYFQARGPAITQFFKDFWADLKGVWNTLKPLIIPVLGAFRSLFETAGQLGAGNTKLLAWLTAAFIGWQTLKTPVMAANAAFNLVLGSIGKVRAAWTGLKGLKGLEMADNVMLPPKTPKPKVQRWGAPLAAEALTQAPAKGPWGSAKPKPPPLGPWQKFTGFLTRWGARFLSIFAPITPLFSSIAAKLGFLMPIVGALGKAFAFVGATIAGLTAPVWAVAAGIAAAVGGLVVLIVRNWDHVKSAALATWDSIKLFGSAVWETLKFVGGSIADIFGTVFGFVDVVLKKFGIDIRGVFTGLGDFFKGLFGGIWDGIKGIGGFIETQFNNLLGWIEDLNSVFQNFVGGWRDFFKKKNDEREGNLSLKTELVQPPVGVDKINLGPSKMELEAPKMPAVEFTSPQEFIAKQKLAPVVDTIPNQVATLALKAMLDPNAIKKEIDALKFADVNLQPTAEMPDIQGVPTDEQVKEKPKASDFLEQGRRKDDTTIEYVNFKGVDELDKTLKSGFTSLLHVEDQILLELKKSGNIDIPSKKPLSESPVRPLEKTLPYMDTPEIQTPPVLDLNVPPVVIERPALPNLRINDPTLNIPPIPNLEVPAVEIEQSQVYASLEEIPNLSIDTPNLAVDAPNLAPLALDPIEKLPQIGLDPIPPVHVEAPDSEAQTTDIQLPPPQVISVPALHQTTNNNTESSEQKTEIVNNITINQQPGENADELTERLMEGMRREWRAGYHD